MFNILNTMILKGKKSPMVCKILSTMSARARSLYSPFPEVRYLLEGMGFRNQEIRMVGLPIAFSIWRPALA
jgi:hypothetical protein